MFWFNCKVLKLHQLCKFHGLLNLWRLHFLWHLQPTNRTRWWQLPAHAGTIPVYVPWTQTSWKCFEYIVFIQNRRDSFVMLARKGFWMEVTLIWYRLQVYLNPYAIPGGLLWILWHGLAYVWNASGSSSKVPNLSRCSFSVCSEPGPFRRPSQHRRCGRFCRRILMPTVGHSRPGTWSSWWHPPGFWSEGTPADSQRRQVTKDGEEFDTVLRSLMWPNVRSYQIQNEINGAHSRRCWNHDTLDYGCDIWSAICLLVIHPHGNLRDPPDIPKIWQHETHLYAGSIMHAKHLSW